MRILSLILLLATGDAFAGWLDATETRELSLHSAGIDKLEIHSGHGFVIVKGEPGLEKITVSAEIRVPAQNRNRAEEIKNDYMDLSLTSSGNTATLTGSFHDYAVWRGDSASVRLTVRIPDHTDVAIEDGTGFIEVSDLDANLSIVDGSGSIDLKNIGGTVSIEDGAGWIDIDQVEADVAIEDRSGAISVSRVGADVAIDDGAGHIKVRDITGDLILVDNASGRLKFSGVQGVIRDQS
jgi:hypothetical protein